MTSTNPSPQLSPVSLGEIQKALRVLVDLPDALIFDLQFILQVLRRKFDKNYLQFLS
jgi:hypothetical protein